MLGSILAFLSAVALMAPVAAEQKGDFDPATIEGHWVLQDGNTVQIAPCGDRLCGKLTGLGGGSSRDRKLDEMNEDRSLRRRQLQGINLLYDLDLRDGFWKGRVYIPAVGKHFDTFVLRSQPDTLKVGTCANEICRWNYWERK